MTPGRIDAGVPIPLNLQGLAEPHAVQQMSYVGTAGTALPCHGADRIATAVDHVGYGPFAQLGTQSLPLGIIADGDGIQEPDAPGREDRIPLRGIREVQHLPLQLRRERPADGETARDVPEGDDVAEYPVRWAFAYALFEIRGGEVIIAQFGAGDLQ